MADTDPTQQGNLFDIHVQIGDGGPAKAREINLHTIVDVFGNGAESGEAGAPETRSGEFIPSRFDILFILSVPDRVGGKDTAYLDQRIFFRATGKWRQNHGLAILIGLGPFGWHHSGAFAESVEKTRTRIRFAIFIGLWAQGRHQGPSVVWARSVWNHNRRFGLSRGGFVWPLEWGSK